MNVFYNRKGLGDVLLVQLMPTKEAAISVTTKGDITLLDHAKTEEWIGINIQNASTYMKIEGNGRIELTTDLVDQIQTALKQNGVDRVLEVDLSPKFVVGHVMAKEKHPNADKLSVCQVDVGEEVLQIVCGAPNVAAGQKVVVAKVGAVMPSGMEIRDAELRGIASSGMICSAKELDLPNAPAEKGILVLSDDAKVGSSFSQ